MDIFLTGKTAETAWAPSFSQLIGGSAAKAIRSAITELKARQAFRRAERKLMALDSQMLKDIGLDRSEIGSVLMDHGRERRNGAQHLSR